MKRKIRNILKVLFIPINRLYFSIFTLINKETILNKNKVYKNLPGEKVLVLAPHVDDETIGCGGAILKYKELEKELAICYLTKSQKRGSKDSAKDIADERKKEAHTVCKKLGVLDKDLFFLSGEDGNLINSDIKNEFLEVIRAVKPDTIFLPIFLDTHVDHYAATIKLLDAYRTNPALFKDVQIFSYESQSPITPLYSNVILDISDFIEEKLELLKLFKSQKLNLESISNSNRINGLAPKLKACEVYIYRPIEEYLDLVVNSKFIVEDNFLSLRGQLKANIDNLSLIRSYKSSIKYKDSI